MTHRRLYVVNGRCALTAALCLALPISACAGRTAPAPDDPPAPTATHSYRSPPALDDGWPTASAEEVGLDRAPLEQMTAAIRRGEAYRNIHAVLIVKDGRLVYEEYFADKDEHGRLGDLGHVVFDRNTRHDLRSVTKSVVSALVGIAVGSGAIRSVDQPLLDFFPEHADLATPERQAITLQHALDMSAGLEWNEGTAYSDSANYAFRMNRSPDPVRFVLERPVVAEPGTRWSYSGGLTQLLGEVVTRATGKPLVAYARDVLFVPLGISDVEWYDDAGRTTPDADSGLRLRPRDTAKLGLLYQQRGRWDGRQVMPAEWVDASLSRRIALADSLVEFGRGATGEHGYAHQWYHARYALPYGRVVAHRAAGNGGQLVFLVPELKLVVVVNAGRYDDSHDSNRLVLERVVPWALGDSAHDFWLERSVRRVAQGEWPEAALTPAERERYAGTYDHEGTPIRVWDEAGVLHMTPVPDIDGDPIHLVPMGNHVFAWGFYEDGRLTKLYWPDEARIEFVLSGGRAVRYLDRTVQGHVYATAERVR